jgi:hypothetical protein
MGLGRPLDAILGAAVVLLILIIRRRLAWVKSTVRDIGVLGTTLVVIAITIFVGGALLEFRLMPARFHLGGRCDISRDPCGSAPNGRPAACPPPGLPAQTRSACPSWSRYRAAGLAIAIQAAWITDVADVNAIIQILS